MIETVSFCTALKFVAHAAPKKDVRLYLNGVLFHSLPEGASLAATDGNRCAVAQMQCAPLPFDGEFILTHEAIKTLLQLFNKDKTGSLAFAPEEGNLRITSTAGTSCLASLVEGKFPDYRRIIPAVTTPTLLPAVSADLLATSCAALSPLARGMNRGVSLTSYGEQGPVVLEPLNVANGFRRALVILMGLRT